MQTEFENCEKLKPVIMQVGQTNTYDMFLFDDHHTIKLNIRDKSIVKGIYDAYMDVSKGIN
jgi:hypothetical protein